MRPRVGVMLSGCGFLDGSEIHEATLTLLFLDQKGAKTVCIAPGINQFDVINHITKNATGEKRNVMTESSRISRGDIKNIKDVNAKNLDALIFPGGFGVAKGISDFAFRGALCVVTPEVERLVSKMHHAGKPLGFICIAPVIAAKVLGSFSPELTIGTDKATRDALIAMGARHTTCKVDEIVVDKKNKIVSTPAYMLGPSISRIALGLEKLVSKVLEMGKR